MNKAIGLVLAFAVGYLCRRFNIMPPAPDNLFAVAMVGAITMGYLLGKQ